MAAFDDIMGSERRGLGYRERSQVARADLEAADRSTLQRAVHDIRAGDKDQRLVKLALEKATLLKSSHDLMQLAAMPEIPVAGRAAAVAAATSGVVYERWPVWTGSVATELAELGELTTTAPEFTEVRQNLGKVFDAHVARHPEAAENIARYRLPKGPEPVMPQWMQNRNRADRLTEERNLERGILFEGNLSVPSHSSSSFQQRDQQEAYWAAVEKYNMTPGKRLSGDNPVYKSALQAVEKQRSEAEVAREKAARAEEASRPARYQEALVRYEKTQSLGDAAAIVALHDSVPKEIQQPREAWMAALTVINSPEGRAAQRTGQSSPPPNMQIGGHDARRLVSVASSHIQQYETEALASAAQQREEDRRYTEGFTRMSGGAPYDRGKDLHASANVLQLHETAGERSGFASFQRERAFSRASRLLAYAMPQELTDQGIPRATAESLIARAKTQLAHETAQREAEPEAARPTVAEARRPVAPAVTPEPAPTRAAPVTVTATAPAAPTSPAEPAWVTNPEVLHKAQGGLGSEGPMGIASARTRPDGYVGFELNGKNIPPSEVLSHFSLTAEQARVLSKPGQMTRVIMHASTYTHIMDRAVARNAAPAVQTAPTTDTAAPKWSENPQMQAEARARFGTEGDLGINRLKTSSDGQVGIEFNGSKLSVAAMATQLGVAPESLTVINTPEGARSAVTLHTDNYARGGAGIERQQATRITSGPGIPQGDSASSAGQSQALNEILQKRMGGAENIQGVTSRPGPNGTTNYVVTTPDSFSRNNFGAVGIDPNGLARRNIPGTTLSEITIPAERLPPALATEMAAQTRSGKPAPLETRPEADVRARGPAGEPHIGGVKGGVLGAVVVGGITAGIAMYKSVSPAEAAVTGGKAALDTAVPGVSDGFAKAREGNAWDRGVAVASTVTGVAMNIPGINTAATIANGSIGVADAVVKGDVDGAAKSGITTATIVGGIASGAWAGGALAGPYGAILGGAVGGIATAAGCEGIVEMSARRIELTPEQKAFYAFTDDLPAKPDDKMSPELRTLVETKAKIVDAQAKLDAAQRDPMSSNPGAARNALESAEKKFTSTFDRMQSDGGLTKAVAELTARNHPELTQPGSPVAPSTDSDQPRSPQIQEPTTPAGATDLSAVAGKAPTNNPNDLSRVAASGRRVTASLRTSDTRHDTAATPVAASPTVIASKVPPAQRRISTGMAPA